jgi:hypothetical protein
MQNVDLQDSIMKVRGYSFHATVERQKSEYQESRLACTAAHWQYHNQRLSLETFDHWRHESYSLV